MVDAIESSGVKRDELINGGIVVLSYVACFPFLIDNQTQAMDVCWADMTQATVGRERAGFFCNPSIHPRLR